MSAEHEPETPPEPLVDGRDAGHVARETDPATADAIRCVVAAYRRPERLRKGDAAPVLDLIDLETGRPTRAAPAEGRPLVLFFGSYT